MSSNPMPFASSASASDPRRRMAIVSPPAISSSSEPLPAPSDDFPMDGVPLPFCRELIDANGGEAAFEGLTTSDVKDHFIVPMTAASRLSLCAQMKFAGDARVQPATCFVCHAWIYKFLDVVRALEAFFANNGGGVVIWLDLFSTSQHSTFSKPPEWWQQTLVSAVGRIGHLVMVMTPWDNPIVLTRAWCMIELYACRSSGSRFGVALPPSERARFLSEIADQAGAFYDMLSKVNTAKSECLRESDRQRIFAAVKGLDGGFSGLDRGVLQTMTEWLQRQLEEEIAHAVTQGREVYECSMMNALGKLFHDMGEYDRSISILEQCVMQRQRILGSDSLDTLKTLRNLADSFRSKGEYGRALTLYEECLQKRKRTLGDDHPDTLASLSDMAMLHEGRGEYDRALPLYEVCLAKRKMTLGDDHPDTLASLSDMAGLLQSEGVYGRALTLYEECLQKRKRTLGDDHPDTLASLMNLANLFASKGEYDRALPLNEECLMNHSRIFGDDHPYTLTALNNLAFLLYMKREYDRALPLYEQCLAKFKRVLGINHPDTCAVSKNFDAVKAAAEAKAAALAPSYGSIRRSEVAFIPHTGQNRGAMGIVRQVMYNGRRFAAKEPLASSSIGARDRRRFMKELEIHYRLHHPSCVSIYGACIDDEGIMLLMEWMDGGSLHLALSNHCEEPVLPRLRMSMARDIADGLVYLHAHRIIHRDIKSSNVLLTSDGRAKLCDFGLAKMIGASSASSSLGLALGTFAWAAPEVLLDGAEHSPASDVYSLGIVMWELMTCEVPFENLDHSQMMARQRNHQRPPVPDPLPSGFPPEYVALMMQCWHQDPAQRPAAREVLDAIIKMDPSAHVDGPIVLYPVNYALPAACTMISLLSAAIPDNTAIQAVAADAEAHVHTASVQRIVADLQLTALEAQSIFVYTASQGAHVCPLLGAPFSSYNVALRNAEADAVGWSGYSFLLYNALLKLPSVALTVYRGLNVPLSQVSHLYRRGGFVWYRSPTSTTTDKNRTMTSFGEGAGGGAGTFVELRVQNAKDIQPFSSVPDEQEFLIPQNTCFKVVQGLSASDIGQLHAFSDLPLNVDLVVLEEVSEGSADYNAALLTSHSPVLNA